MFRVVCLLVVFLTASTHAFAQDEILKSYLQGGMLAVNEVNTLKQSRSSSQQLQK